jgi:hypothetical protein
MPQERRIFVPLLLPEQPPPNFISEFPPLLPNVPISGRIFHLSFLPNNLFPRLLVRYHIYPLFHRTDMRKRFACCICSTYTWSSAHAYGEAE